MVTVALMRCRLAEIPQIKLPNVKDVQTRFSLKEVKADGAWPLGQLERR
jgi:hypothetical protein